MQSLQDVEALKALLVLVTAIVAVLALGSMLDDHINSNTDDDKKD